MSLEIRPKPLAIVLAAIAAALLVAHLLGWTYAWYTPGGHNWRLFNLDYELNIPTWYSGVLLLIAGASAGLVVVMKRGTRFARHWFWLAVAFVYMSLDEVASIHEELNHPLRRLYTFPKTLQKRTWVVAGVVIVVIVFAIYRRFLADLPARTRLLFVMSGAIYVTGLLGFEFLGGVIKEAAGNKGPIWYQFASMGEEGFEMWGVVLFIYAVLSYIQDANGTIRLTIGRSDPGTGTV